jgi:hypothetical protein
MEKNFLLDEIDRWNQLDEKSMDLQDEMLEEDFDTDSIKQRDYSKGKRV